MPDVTNEQIYEVLQRIQNNPTTVAAMPDSMRAIISDSAKYRRQRKADRLKIRELEGKVPKDGDVVLTGDDARAHAEFKALGLTPAQVKAALDKAANLEGTIQSQTRDQVAKEAAALAGLAPELLAELADRQGAKGFTLEVRDGPAGTDGKVTRVAYARPHGPDGKPVAGDALALADYADQNLTAYAGALVVSEGGAGTTAAAGTQGGTAAQGTTGGTAMGGTPAPRPVTPFHRQTTGGKAPSGASTVAKFKEEANKARAARPNPLAPPKVAGV